MPDSSSLASSLLQFINSGIDQVKELIISGDNLEEKKQQQSYLLKHLWVRIVLHVHKYILTFNRQKHTLDSLLEQFIKKLLSQLY